MKTERLTIKYDDTSIQTYVLKDDKNNQKAREKLGQKEDDDEEIGIDSHILFQALKDGYYAYDTAEDNIIHFKHIISVWFNGFSWLIKDREDFSAHKINRYGITWALTREELEK